MPQKPYDSRLKGEFRWIETLKTLFNHGLPPGWIGIGDDAAIIPLEGGRSLAATCDVQVDGIHFRREWSPAGTIGKRAVEIVISDLAAMGAKPRWGLASLMIPHDVENDYFDELNRGIAESAADAEMIILGGNLSATTGPMALNLFVVGDVARNAALLRSGAKPGDTVWVSSGVGGAAAGLALLRRFGTGYPRAFGHLVDAYRSPKAQIPLGRYLADCGVVTAAVDLSDGLAADIGHILQASNVGAIIELDELPLPDGIKPAAEITGADPMDWALFAGDGYQLIFTVSGTIDKKATEDFAAAAPVKIHSIGRITEEAGVLIGKSGADTKRIPLKGWNHFLQ